MTRFSPCIDLHAGQVKQIIGASLSDSQPTALLTNFVSDQPPSYYAQLYRKHQLTGGHVIKLGPGNDEAALEALQAWPDGMHIGGGIDSTNAAYWLEQGAQKVIVTSYLFPDAKFDLDRLRRLAEQVEKRALVVDVSCRKRGDKWIVAMNKWQTLTDMQVDEESLAELAEFSSEFLIHAADVEGLCQGIDEDLVERLGKWSTIPTTYAGGARSIDDLDTVKRLSGGKVDLTYGSSLDIFGGTQVKFLDLVEYNSRQ